MGMLKAVAPKNMELMSATLEVSQALMFSLKCSRSLKRPLLRGVSKLRSTKDRLKRAKRARLWPLKSRICGGSEGYCTCISHREISHPTTMYPLLYYTVVISCHLPSPGGWYHPTPTRMLPGRRIRRIPLGSGRLDVFQATWWSRGGHLPRMEWWLCRFRP